MKPFQLLLACTALFALVSCEPPVGKRPLVFNSWPPKSGKQLARNPGPVAAGSKQRTLVVQIRSDQPVPLVLKGRPGHGHAHAHSHAHAYTHAHGHNHGHVHSHLLHAQTHVRGPPPQSHHHHPIKLSSAPVYLKAAGSALQPKPAGRKPLKIKLNNIAKPKSKPSFGYEKPFKFEQPTTVSYSETQSLPLDTHANFISDHFSPIYTVPAPNLALHDNQLHDEPTSTYLPPTQSTVQPQTYLPPKPSTAGFNQYQVVEEYETNDQTLSDPFSGSQTLFAPDPDPSLPTSKIRPAVEPFNQPSNNKPLPADVQSNHLAPAQPLVQIIGAQAAAQTAPQIYPIQFTQQAALQPLITANVAAVQAAPIPIYNPTYLVTQSNQLYSQHQQQLFKPSVENIVETGYVNADLTQEVASNGQILQAAKDPHHNIHPVLDVSPQFAALIAGPALGEESVYETAPFHLANVAAAAGSSAPEGGFVVSNYYSSPQDSSQLLQAYAEEEAQRQRLETEQAQYELQKQQHHLQQLKQQAEEQELRAQEQLHQQQQLQQLQQFQHEQQQQLQLQQIQQQQQQQQQQRQQHRQQQLQQQQQQQQQQELDPAASAFEEHQRLVQQQLGDQPLRIFVPDEEGPEAQRLQKRSDDVKKGTVEDVENTEKDSFEVSTSVEVSGEQQNAASK